MKNTDFCYFSGMLGPAVKSCKEAPLDLDENSISFPFGPALTASFVTSEIRWEGEGSGIKEANHLWENSGRLVGRK